LQQALLKELRGANASIDLALFEFSSPTLAQALASAAERGVLTRLVVDCQQTSRLPPLPQGMDVRCLEGRGSTAGGMHDKFVLLDAERILTGSFNWTKGAEYHNFENLLLEDDPSVVGRYQALFRLLWSRAHTVPWPVLQQSPRQATAYQPLTRPKKTRRRLK